MSGFRSKTAMANADLDDMVRTLEVEEGRVYGARYFTVKPMGYMPNWENQTWNKMVEWTVATFGPTPDDGVWTPSARWYVNNAKFWFRNEKDLTMFILRWS